MRHLIVSIALIALFAGFTYADDLINPIAPDATVDQSLGALKTRGDTLHDFTGEVRLTHNDISTGDSSTDVGTMVFQKLPNGDTRIRINFTATIYGDKRFDKHHEYTLSDGWLRDRDYDKKVESDRQVVQPGQKINLLKLGEGPFPLPIGQDPADVKKQFDVTKVPPAKDDPPGTVHLQLIPKPGSEFVQRFQQIDVWPDRATGMPTRITTIDRSGDTTETTDLTNLHLNAGVKDSDFDLPEVQGWTVTQDPYEQ